MSGPVSSGDERDELAQIGLYSTGTGAETHARKKNTVEGILFMQRVSKIKKNLIHEQLQVEYNIFEYYLSLLQ